MNQDWQEKRIAALFHEMKREDERRAPSFSKDWHKAMSRLKKRGRLAFPASLVFRAAVAATLVAIIGFAIVFLRAISEQSISEETKVPGALIVPIPYAEVPSSPPSLSMPEVIESPRWELAKIEPRRVRPAQRRAAASISQWQSPTDFLLKTPGEQLLKTVPRLGDLSMGIKAFIPDEKN